MPAASRNASGAAADAPAAAGGRDPGRRWGQLELELRLGIMIMVVPDESGPPRAGGGLRL
jgi:hypothetical protein